jgi:hypothetical protein
MVLVSVSTATNRTIVLLTDAWWLLIVLSSRIRGLLSSGHRFGDVRGCALRPLYPVNRNRNDHARS